MPPVFSDATALNAKVLADKDSFSVPDVEELPKPSPQQIEENKAKWGYSA
ncbi:MAG: hypothetical protein IH827_10160 [Myxococcales bacterium]|nr:hypothetical protein [Myxococcales bacterium]